MHNFDASKMNFSNRHIGIDSKAEKIMLEYLGLKNIESLIEETIPEEIRLKQNISLEAEMSEAQFLDHIYKLSQENRYFKNYSTDYCSRRDTN